jgi:hypothetical protein
MDDDPLLLRLGDLKPTESILVRCRCGRGSEFPYGFLQRRYRLPSTTLVFDLQFKLRCQCCKGEPTRISIVDERNRHREDAPERVIVGAEKSWLRLVE